MQNLQTRVNKYKSVVRAKLADKSINTRVLSVQNLQTRVNKYKSVVRAKLADKSQ